MCPKLLVLCIASRTVLFKEILFICCSCLHMHNITTSIHSLYQWSHQHHSLVPRLMLNFSSSSSTVHVWDGLGMRSLTIIVDRMVGADTVLYVVVALSEESHDRLSILPPRTRLLRGVIKIRESTESNKSNKSN